MLEGDLQSVYSSSCSPIDSQLTSILAGKILSHGDSDIGGSPSALNTKHDWILSSEVLSMCLHGSNDQYYIQGTVSSSNSHVPLLWLLVDTTDI